MVTVERGWINPYALQTPKRELPMTDTPTPLNPQQGNTMRDPAELTRLTSLDPKTGEHKTAHITAPELAPVKVPTRPDDGSPEYAAVQAKLQEAMDRCPWFTSVIIVLHQDGRTPVVLRYASDPEVALASVFLAKLSVENL